MTPAEFSEVDHDLLADYVGGALGGTPEQATVARLIDEDPAWGRAYAALAPAMELVRADLADWAAPAPEMPLAVADRIAAALAGAGPVPTPAGRPDADGLVLRDAADPHDAGGPLHGGADRTELAASDHPAGSDLPAPVGRVPGSVTVPAQTAGGHRRTGGAGRPTEGPGRSTGPGRQPRRWARMAGPVVLAAASMTAVGLGVGHLITAEGGGGAGLTADSGRAENAASAGAPAPLAAEPFRTTGPARRSGTEYTPERLSAGNRSALPSPNGRDKKQSADAAPGDPRLSAAGGLDRLAGPDALNACLAAITAEHAGGPVTVDLVDYASFRGQPALVVTFVDAGGARWAWVSGPECGVPGSGADTRFRTRVG
ncbi:hypothetical protein GA0070624_0841 [Micromonospora rhizosphaerae]|uniref:Uncharacterized protein n=1 Tax=Micromonospora rhizosphaerae TaxID=568872 RepID=A0A1C6RFM4_9ACTN|nr:hypothetical protein [Micromonospora rhizosphaerae]SCL15852.1 hypothetical protein GA0070624_0841 [Micromonospora rhizosphaerae]